MLDPLQTIDFSKYMDGLVPAIIQDYRTQKVLMLGFMNDVALRKTQETGKITFYSRSNKRLWRKGEKNGNELQLKQILVDCDKDTLLIKAEPTGAVCETGADTCWSEKNHKEDFLFYLEHIVQLRKNSSDENSYVRQLFSEGPAAIGAKLEAKSGWLAANAADVNQALFLKEAADLLFHYIVLLQAKSCTLSDVINRLQQQHQSK